MNVHHRRLAPSDDLPAQGDDAAGAVPEELPPHQGLHPLGELGGDRVVRSNDLKDTLLRSGTIKPYRRYNLETMIPRLAFVALRRQALPLAQTG